jgi:hypothetical protein
MTGHSNFMKPTEPPCALRVSGGRNAASNPVNIDNAQGNTSKDAARKALKRLAPDRIEEALIEGLNSASPRKREWASAQLTANPQLEPRSEEKVPPAIRALIDGHQVYEGDVASFAFSVHPHR